MPSARARASRPTMRAIPVLLMYVAPPKPSATASVPGSRACAHARSSAASARASTSPCRSITATAPCRRTVASRSRVGITASSQAQRQLDGVVAVVAALARLVHHVLDEEQPPPAGALAALELRLEVRHLRAGHGPGAAEVRDLDAQAVALGDDPDGHRPVVAVAVGVLHRVHRRLAHGRAEAVEAVALEAEWGDRRAHAVDGQALVARPARELELGQHAR